MGITSSTDPKTETFSDPKSQNNEEAPAPAPSEELGDSSPSEKLGDSSTVWRDPVDSESDQPQEEGGGGDADGEEEGECGFCLFMKGGGCKDSFIAWEECVEKAEKNKEDIVTNCMEVTSMLKKCMDEHSDYYQPILAAEKAAEAEVKKELEAEKKKEEEEKAEKKKEEEEKISEEEVAAKKQAQGKLRRRIRNLSLCVIRCWRSKTAVKLMMKDLLPSTVWRDPMESVSPNELKEEEEKAEVNHLLLGKIALMKLTRTRKIWSLSVWESFR
ncbi:unnamed protein product [Arabidopsis halleri]